MWCVPGCCRPQQYQRIVSSVFPKGSGREEGLKPANLSKLINYADTHRSKLRSLGRWVTVFGHPLCARHCLVCATLSSCVGAPLHPALRVLMSLLMVCSGVWWCGWGGDGDENQNRNGRVGLAFPA